MKKLIYFLMFIMTLTSCTKDENDNNSNKINPPDWIIGTWYYELENDIYMDNGFKFTDDDFIIILYNQQESIKESLFPNNQAVGDANVIEEISQSRYYIKINFGSIVGGHTQEYEFVKINADKIQLLDGVADAYYVRQ